MWGWIVAIILYLLGIGLIWLEEDGRSFGIKGWLFAVIWPIVAALCSVCELAVKAAERWGCYKAYKRGFKEGRAGKPKADLPDYPQWYHDGYICGSEKANQDNCALG
jgi:hypothetical protein